IAPPFHRRTTRASGSGSSRRAVMFTPSLWLRTAWLRSLSVAVGASQTWPRSSPGARITSRSAGTRAFGPAGWRRASAASGSTAVDQLAWALAVVVRHRLGRAAVEDGQLAAARAAGGQALQQRGALPDRAGARPAGLRADIRPDAGLVGQVGLPVDEPGVVIGDEDLPLVAGQLAAPGAQGAVR